MTIEQSRKFILAMQVSLDGFIQDANGSNDWVESWADALQTIDDVDLFLLGRKMFPDYGKFWHSIFLNPQQMPQMSELPSEQARVPSIQEIAYANLAAKTPHVVLSTTLDSIPWPETKIVKDLDEIRAIKKTPGKNTYVVGGAEFASNLMDAGLIDEIHLIVHPVILGSGRPLFAVTQKHLLKFINAQPGKGGKVILAYQTN